MLPALILLALSGATLRAQTTAFSYQGQLSANGGAADGIYDLRFTIYDSGTNGNLIAGPATNSATSVSNGLFTVALDFGNVFGGNARWLELGVRTNGSTGGFTTLSPRQQITSAPYSIQSLSAGTAAVASSANSVSAANVTGTLALTQLPAAIITNGTSGVNISGTFTGNGTGVTNLPFSSVGDGALSASGGTFSSATYMVGPGPHNVVATDVNGDGKLDLISANEIANTLTILTNNGSGILVSNASYTVAGANDVVAADVNGDGKLDLISTSGSSLVILTNSGNGAFGSNTTLNVGGTCQSVAAADVNGDGKMDLIAANVDGKSVVVFTNNGGGVFSSNASYSLGSSDQPNSIVAADINGDGKPDIICANMSSIGSLEVLTNDGSGHFAVSLSVNDQYSFGVAVADINGDGKPDIVFVDYLGGLNVLTNDGSGNFPNLATYNIPYNVFSVTMADANGDGKPDVIFVDNAIDTLNVWTNNGSGQFGSYASYTVGFNPEGVTAANLNGNGYTDLITANTGTETLTVLTQVPQISSLAAMTFNNSANVFSGTFSGNGSGLTNLSLGSFSAAIVTNTETGVTLGGTFFGNGGRLTNLSLSSLPTVIITNTETGVTLSGSFSGNGGGLTNLNLNLVNVNGAMSVNTNWTITGNTSNGFANAIVLIQNNNTGANASPALRVQSNGSNTPDGALSVSAQNLTGPIALFGNASAFVVTIANDGTIDAKAFNTTSDRNAKEHFAQINPQEVLARVAGLPITQWNFKSDAARHIGPMAQDFYQTFHVGADDRHIATVDEDGVALAAIQGLNEKVEDGNQKSADKIQKLETENADLKARLAKLEQLINEKIGATK